LKIDSRGKILDRKWSSRKGKREEGRRKREEERGGKRKEEGRGKRKETSFFVAPTAVPKWPASLPFFSS
jgi:hypothetical protein